MVRIHLPPAGSLVRTWISRAVRKIAGQGRSAMARVLRGCFALQPRLRARQRIAEAGLRHVEVIVADVSAHPFAPNAFEFAFSRFGVMFFSDPQAAFQMFGAR